MKAKLSIKGIPSLLALWQCRRAESATGLAHLQNATARSAGSWFVQAEELLPPGRRIDGEAAGAASTDDSIGDRRPV